MNPITPADRLTEEQLAELVRLEKEATPGPWKGASVYGGFAYGLVTDQWSESSLSVSDIMIAAALRNAAPSLIAEVQELRDVCQAAKVVISNQVNLLHQIESENKLLRLSSRGCCVVCERDIAADHTDLTCPECARQALGEKK